METPKRELDERFLDALEPLVPALNRFARSLTRGREEAQDVAAEAIRSAYERFGSMRDEQALASYLFTICSRNARSEWIRKERLAPIDSVKDNISDMTSPEMYVDMLIVSEAITSLPDAERDTLILHLIVGMKLEEISMIQQVSLSAVKMRLYRGRQRLQKKLGINHKSSSQKEKEVGYATAKA